MTTVTLQGRTVVPDRAVLYGVLVLSALSAAGALISVAGGLSPTLLDATGPKGRLSIPVPMTVFQVAMAVLAGSRRRRVALSGSALVAATLLLGVVSGFFDGGYADETLTAANRGFQITLVVAMTVVGALATLRFVQVQRRRPGRGAATRAT